MNHWETGTGAFTGLLRLLLTEKQLVVRVNLLRVNWDYQYFSNDKINNAKNS